MFSIIMPVWNRANLVSRAIDSVLAQTFIEYELLIIDDGSEDHLEDVIRPYLSDRVCYYRIPKSGVAAARNLGIEKARYPYIAYLDSDNRWHTDFLKTMSEAISGAGREFAAAYCLAECFVRDTVTGGMYSKDLVGEIFRFKKLLESNFIDLNTFIHSKNILQFTGVFDETIKRLSDWDLIIRITGIVEPVFIPKVLVDYNLDLAENTITKLENVETAISTIHKKYRAREKPYTFIHDSVPYTWQDLSDRKFRNFWVYHNQHQLNTSDYTAWGYPFMLQIEPTNACNLACPLCPTGRGELGRKTEHMSLYLYKGIIDDMREYLMFLVIWDWGEPFMHPQLPEMIRYATDHNIRTVTSTNAHFLNNDVYLERILHSGLSSLIVAIDSMDGESYRIYRQKGDLGKAVSGLKNLVQMKKKLGSKTRINFRTVIMKQNEHELPALRRLAEKAGVDCFTAKSLNPSCGSVSLDSELVPDNPKYQRFEYDQTTGQRIRIDSVCHRIWTMSNILSNGDVVPCCYDYNASMKVGNVKEKPFSQIWNSQEYRELRRKIYLDKESIEKCAHCWINFKLSRNGWFSEFIDFREDFSSHLKRIAKQRFGDTMLWEYLRKIKQSLTHVF
jgi:radical SAM protein with 4Fe4S-binding SPASM domain